MTPSHSLPQMRDLVRAEQRAHLDAAAYRLLRHLETDLEAESLEVVRYYRACDHFRLCLWAQLMLPVASFKPDDDTRSVQHDGRVWTPTRNPSLHT